MLNACPGVWWCRHRDLYRCTSTTTPFPNSSTAFQCAGLTEDEGYGCYRCLMRDCQCLACASPSGRKSPAEFARLRDAWQALHHKVDEARRRKFGSALGSTMAARRAVHRWRDVACMRVWLATASPAASAFHRMRSRQHEALRSPACATAAGGGEIKNRGERLRITKTAVTRKARLLKD